MSTPAPVSLLGLGAMGAALAGPLLSAGHRLTVWNRTPERAAALTPRGARPAATATEAARAAELVVVCLLDDDATRQVLQPLVETLRGRTLINLTSTTPAQARQMARWAAEHGIDYLDGGVMAVPEMIGAPGAAVLYSGSKTAFTTAEPVLSLWGEHTYFGTDAGLASLYDLGMLAAMYVMFAGFFHGAAMTGSADVPAQDFAAYAVPFLSHMVDALPEFAAVVDARDYTGPGQQSLGFSDQRAILGATADAGIAPDAVHMVQRLIDRQVQAGHGSHGFARIFESITHPAP